MMFDFLRKTKKCNSCGRKPNKHNGGYVNYVKGNDPNFKIRKHWVCSLCKQIVEADLKHIMSVLKND